MIPGGKTDLFSGPGYLNNFPGVLPLQVYSYLSDFTGFRFATLHVWELTVSNATAKAITGPAMKCPDWHWGMEIKSSQEDFSQKQSNGHGYEKSNGQPFCITGQ